MMLKKVEFQKKMMNNRGKKMKPGVLITAFENEGWIGGVYYIKNVAFQLSLNENITNKYQLYIYVSKENAGLFEGISDKIKIVHKFKKSNTLDKIKESRFLKGLNIKYVFPSTGSLNGLFGIKNISWIPDFQHNRLSGMFSKEELRNRTMNFKKIALSRYSLILSSNDCLNDFQNFYSKKKKNVYVMPFVSYIEKEILSLNESFEAQVLEKFGLVGKKYACISNQFWQHKNHMVVFKAIEEFVKTNPDDDFLFAFTGKMEDYREPEYIQNLLTIAQKDEIKKRIIILGFVERTEQLSVMKNAEFIIQPSLFEGWGTVVEDSKVLDKTILLSDIPVHREQKNDKCIMFDPYNAQDLAEKIEQECKKQHHSSIVDGIENMYKSAIKYSQSFEKMLAEN